MKRKTFYAFISILIVLALIYVALSAFYFKEYNFLNWTIPSSNSSNNNEPDTSSDNNVSVVEENGIAVCTSLVDVSSYSALGISEDVESVYSLTLNVLPEETTNKKVVYALSFGGILLLKI